MKILIIDDNKINLEYYSISLMSSENTIYSADNGKKGIEIALKVIPDLIILDLRMKKMSGYDVFEKMLKYDKLKEIAEKFTFIITAEDNINKICNKLNLPYYRVLRKPFSNQLLLKRYNIEKYKYAIV